MLLVVVFCFNPYLGFHVVSRFRCENQYNKSGAYNDYVEGDILNSIDKIRCTSIEFSIKVICWIECEGHLEDFHMELMSWIHAG